MKNFFKNASIAKLLTMAYLGISLPAMLTVAHTVMSLNHEMAIIQQDPGAYSFEDEVINDVGPFRTAIFALRSSLPTYQASDPLTDYGRDLRFAVVGIYLFLLIAGVGVVVILWRQLHKQLENITEKIGDLVDGKLGNEIAIEGPKDTRIVGEQLDRLRARLNQSEVQQSQFLRHISHEIKTPLTSIKEGTQLLKDELLGPLSKEQHEISDILSNSTKELQTSIENLLNYNSAISVNNIRQRETVDLATLITDVLDKHALTIMSKELKIRSNKQHESAFVDSEQIRTVFDNLLSNAVKFSPKGGNIWVRLERINDRIVFSIRDQGVGINSEQESAVFDAFYVGNQTVSGPLKGTGLGLSIARQYIEAHKGMIKSIEVPKGALFEVTLPG